MKRHSESLIMIWIVYAIHIIAADTLLDPGLAPIGIRPFTATQFPLHKHIDNWLRIVIVMSSMTPLLFIARIRDVNNEISVNPSQSLINQKRESALSMGSGRLPNIKVIQRI